MPHAVARLRAQRLARSQKPFAARGALLVRCERCRVAQQYCMCAWQPEIQEGCAGACLIMADKESLKPSNTGWLIADVLPDTHAFLWTRTEPDPDLLALLQDPQWQPWLVFPAESAATGQQIMHELPGRVAEHAGRRPLFVLLDGTWQEARKMFRKSEYLQKLPVLSLQPDQVSRYHLRTAQSAAHLSTAEVMVQCLQQAGDEAAAQALSGWFTRFNRHYLAAKRPMSSRQEQLLLRQ